MKIDIILPFKEIFSNESASAVSLTVKNSIEFSKYKKDILVYGQNTPKPFYKKNFIGINTKRILHFGNNLSIAKNYLKIHRNNNKKNQLIEIHNRPYLFNFIAKHIKNEPVILYYHNDPTTMKGSKTVKQREFILKKAAGVIFVSDFIKQRFLTGIKSNPKHIFVLPNGIKRTLKKIPNKKKRVMFVGRLVHEKGVHIFVNSIKNIINNFTNWEFYIIGTSKAGLKNLQTNYEKNNIKIFLSFGKRAKYLGFLPNNNVKRLMNSSSILVVPSIWDEPFALTALEGIASSQAVIGSKRGGLAEMLAGTGILIKDINSGKIESKLKELMVNKEKLKFYQKKSWNNFSYNQEDISKKQDLIREKIFNNHLNNKKQLLS